MKKYVLIAGVNGAGKSTLYQTLPNLQNMPRVNTDEILKEFGDWRNAVDVMRAGKIAVKIVLPKCDFVAFYDNTVEFERFAIYKNGKSAST